ncbi:MAG: hypothetical protein DWQ01_04525 [Planctomycetota bacterium]|nr:MAG: hypothetical protein DWQ01_04525 [Planctomycetota bacterium]
MATTPGIPGVAGTGGYAPRIAITRQKTSRRLLKIRWDYPVYKPEQPESTNDTVAEMVRSALPREEAFRFLSGNDPRPLLVVRECNFCVGTGAALLSKSQDNDRTILLTRWFHCLKLPTDTLAPDHPFRNVFEKENPCHLFLASADGSSFIPLSGAQSQSDLWDAMNAILKVEYKKDPDRAVKDLMKLLAHLDHLDSMLDTVQEQYEEEVEKRGPKSKKLNRYKKNMAKLEKDKEKAMEKEKDLGELELRPEVVERKTKEQTEEEKVASASL